MAHTCHATDCNTPVPPEMWGCRKHWYMVPRDIRLQIVQTYREGQCKDWKPSRAYLVAARAAVVVLADREGKTPDTKLYDYFLARTP